MKTIQKYSKIAIMIIMTAIVFLSSCIKDDDELHKANLKYFQDKEAAKDSATWQWQYIDAGVIPTGSGVIENELVGTSWLLFKVSSGFGVVTQYDDTLHFVTKTKYYANSDSTNLVTYILQKVQNNYSLTFQPLSVIRHSQASTTDLGVGFANVPVGTIIFANFTDPFSTTKNFTVWFKKL